MSTTTSNEYEVLEKIGHGSFGVIRRVRRKSDGLILCRKEINYGKMSQKEREQLHAEFQCLSSLRHPNIVAYYHREHLKAQQELHLYMEYCGSGDLGRVIKNLQNTGQRATEGFVWSAFAQLVSALYRCHYGVDAPQVGADLLGVTTGPGKLKPPEGGVVIMHRDLKPENVFLAKGNSVKLGDFGLSKMIKSHDFASTYVGTPYYMSPEICAAERYTSKSDIWALGCIVYELCARQPPFNAKTHYQLVQKIKSGRYDPLPECYSPDLGAVIEMCLRVNPDRRPSTFDLLNLPVMRLMRKEMEVSELRDSVLEREAAVARRETALAASKSQARQEIDAALRREWEVKARLEIDKHVNMEIENLQRQFEIEVRARVDAELKKRAMASLNADSNTGRNSSGNSSGNSATTSAMDLSSSKSTASTAGSTFTDATASTDATEVSLDSPEVSSSSSSRKYHGTPMRRVQTMFAGNLTTPGDVEMSEPSPMAISSLSLSPRRNAATKAPLPPTGNIFRAAAVPSAAATAATAATADTIWSVPRDARTPDSDDDDLVPSPTRNIKSSKNPFMAKNRPALPSKQLSNKPLPHLPSGGGDGTKSAPQQHERSHTTTLSPSPSRRLSKIPSAANLMHRAQTDSSVPVLSRKASAVTLSGAIGGGGGGTATGAGTGFVSKKEEVPLGKVAAKNNIRGRTLVELQQARAGGRPLSAVIAPGGENLSPSKKGAFRDRLGAGRRSSDTAPGSVAVWDPERDEMPSPFLSRTKARSRC